MDLISLLKVGLISLGIAVPSSMCVLAVNAFSSGLINSIIFKKKKTRLTSLILLAVLFSLISFRNGWQMKIVFLFLFLILMGVIFGHLIKNNWRPLFLIFFLTLGYLVVAFIDGQPVRKIVRQEPVYDNYVRDMNCYLKTYFLIEKGVPFYQAYAVGEKGDALTDDYPGEIWGWKTPFLFYLWKIFPRQDGRSIYWLFVAFILSIPFMSYLIAKEFVNKNLASLSSFLVWPYFLLPLKEITFIQVEWWGLIFFLIGFYFLLKKRAFWATLFFTFTLFSRELFAIHLFSLLMVLFFFKKKKMKASVLLPFLFILLFYLLVHIPNVGQYEDLKSLDGWWRRSEEVSKSIGWQYARTTLAFNSQQYLLFSFFPFRISLILSSFGLFYLYIKKRQDKYLLFLVSFLPFFFFQFKPGMMTLYHDYWGIYYVPLTLITVPTIIRILHERH